MQLIWNDDRSRFEAIGAPSERHIPKGAQFRYDDLAKRWFTADVDLAKKLAPYATPTCQLRLSPERLENFNASKATTTAYQAPHPADVEPFPYQNAGVEYATKRQNTLFADDMGLGKTVQALLTVNTDPFARNILIVCPASLKINWSREAKTWLTGDHWTIGIAKGDSFPSDVSVVIVNYDILERHERIIRDRVWDFLIIDEAHLLRNGKRTIRGASVFGRRVQVKDEATRRSEWVWDPAPIPAYRVLALTGTPEPNRPRELWPLIHFLWPEEFDDWVGFHTRYCGAKRKDFGWDTSGANEKALPELQVRLREVGMIRRLKEEVLKDLPPKLYQLNVIPSDDVRELLVEEQQVTELKAETQIALRAKIEIAKASSNPAVHQAAIEALKAEINVSFTEMARIRCEMALAKVPYVVDRVRECISDRSHKVIVMGFHREMLLAIHKAFGKRAVKLLGGMSEKKKQEAVDRFQNDPECLVFVGNILAAGVGHTLTQSAHVIFPEMTWVPGDNRQAEDRAHRIGQTMSVLIEYMMFEDSLDCVVAQSVVRKTRIAQKTLDDLPPGVLREDVEEILDTPETPFSEPPATATRTRRSIEGRAQSLARDQIDAISVAMGMLHAAGPIVVPNRADAAMIERLVSTAVLSPREAALGYFLVGRYRASVPESLIDRIRGKKIN